MATEAVTRRGPGPGRAPRLLTAQPQTVPPQQPLGVKGHAAFSPEAEVPGEHPGDLPDDQGLPVLAVNWAFHPPGTEKWYLMPAASLDLLGTGGNRLLDRQPRDLHFRPVARLSAGRTYGRFVADTVCDKSLWLLSLLREKLFALNKRC